MTAHLHGTHVEGCGEAEKRARLLREAHAAHREAKAAEHRIQTALAEVRAARAEVRRTRAARDLWWLTAYDNGITMHDLAAHVGLTVARISQVVARARENLPPADADDPRQA